MPGTNLNLDLPNVGDTMSVMVAKTKAALSAIQDDLTPKIVSSELNINAGLSFNGNAATGLGYATLVSGNAPTAPGSIYYNAGEFYAIDGTGTVKLTNLGTIAVAGVKGIGGDYGNIANSALVYYDNTSGEYRLFKGDGVSYGIVVASKLTLRNATGFSASLQVSSSQSVTYTATLPSALPSVVSVLTLDNTGAIKTDGVISTNLQLTGTSYVKRGNRTRTLPFVVGPWNYGAGSLPGWTSAGSKGCISLVPGTYYYAVQLEDTSERLQSLTVYLSATTNATALALNTTGNTGLTSSVGAVAGATGSCAAGGVSRAIVLTPTSPAVLGAGNVYWVSFAVPASSGAELYSMDITTDVP